MNNKNVMKILFIIGLFSINKADAAKTLKDFLSGGGNYGDVEQIKPNFAEINSPKETPNLATLNTDYLETEEADEAIDSEDELLEKAEYGCVEDENQKINQPAKISYSPPSDEATKLVASNAIKSTKKTSKLTKIFIGGGVVTFGIVAIVATCLGLRNNKKRSGKPEVVVIEKENNPQEPIKPDSLKKEADADPLIIIAEEEDPKAQLEAAAKQDLLEIQEDINILGKPEGAFTMGINNIHPEIMHGKIKAFLETYGRIVETQQGAIDCKLSLQLEDLTTYINDSVIPMIDAKYRNSIRNNILTNFYNIPSEDFSGIFNQVKPEFDAFVDRDQAFNTWLKDKRNLFLAAKVILDKSVDTTERINNKRLFIALELKIFNELIQGNIPYAEGPMNFEALHSLILEILPKEDRGSYSLQR